MRTAEHAPTPAVLRWLLGGDPAIRRQVMRDLEDAPPDAVAAERARIGVDGWGARLLDAQSPLGNWGGPAENRGWLPTIYALTVVKDLGVDPAGDRARVMLERVNRNLVFHPSLGERPLLYGETEACINGRLLAIGAYFGEPSDALATQLLDAQRDDGGWNCEPSARSSFHSTICVLEGLLAYERAGRASPAIAAARERGEAYLLDRRMFRSLRTGDVVDPRWLRFAFPPFWHYDVLRGLDYLRDAGVSPDARIDDAIEAIVARRDEDGRWPMDVVHEEPLPIAIEPEIGRASRWNTLRALRVLRWAAGA